MRAGDFCLAQIDDATGRLIQAGQKSRWNHVFSAASDTTFLNPMIPTIQVVSGVLGDGPRSVLVSPPFTEAERAAIAVYLAAEVGKPYSLKACFWLALCHILPSLQYLHDPLDDHGWVCSTAYTWAVWSAGPTAWKKLGLGDRAWDSILPIDLATAFGVL